MSIRFNNKELNSFVFAAGILAIAGAVVYVLGTAIAEFIFPSFVKGEQESPRAQAFQKIKEIETQPPGLELEIVAIVHVPIDSDTSGTYIVRDVQTGVNYFATINRNGFSVTSPIYDKSGKIVATEAANAKN